MDSRKVTRARDKVKGTGKWQINYLTLFYTFFLPVIIHLPKKKMGSVRGNVGM
jgi:hypothetical protein